MSTVSTAPESRFEALEHPFGSPHASPVPGNLVAMVLAIACLVAGWMALSAVFGAQGRYLEALAQYQVSNSEEWVFIEKSEGGTIVHAAIPEKMVSLIPGLDPEVIPERSVVLARLAYPALETSGEAVQALLAQVEEDRLALLSGSIPANFQGVEEALHRSVIAQLMAQAGPMGLRPTGPNGLAFLVLLGVFFVVFTLVGRNRSGGMFYMSLAAVSFILLSVFTVKMVGTSSDWSGLGDIPRTEIVLSQAVSPGS